MKEQTLKLLAVTGFSLITVLAVTAMSTYATGYEISIYRVYPWWFWCGIIGVVAIGTAILLGSADIADRRLYFGIGVVVVLLANCLLLFLPLIRGYYGFGGGDMLTHRGYVLDIQEFNRIGVGNYYPGVHVHIAMAMDVTGLDFFTLKNVISPAFSVLYWLGLLTLGKRLFDKPAKVHYFTPFALLPVFKRWEHFYAGQMTSLALLPLLLYAIFSVDRARARYLTVGVVIFLYVVFTHPVTTVVSLFIIGIVAASRFVSSRLEGGSLSVRESFPVFALPMAVVVLFYSWYYSFTGIVYMTVGMVAALLGGSGASQASEYSSALSSMPLTSVQIAELALTRKGLELVLAFVTVLAIVYMANRFRHGTVQIGWTHIFTVASFGFFSAVSAVFLISPMMLDWFRMFWHAELFAVLIIGMATYAYVQASQSRKSRLVAVGLVVIVLSSLIVFGFYNSHLTRSPTDHITESRVDSMEWFVEHRDQTETAYGFNKRYVHALTGVESNTDVYTEWTTPIPDHFSYNNSSTFATSNRNGSYLVITTKLERWYPALHPEYPQHWKYSPSDFRKLDRDDGLAKVYDNDGVRVYKVTTDEDESDEVES